MPRTLSRRLFEIGFKGYYGEGSEWHAERVRAVTRADALRIFAARHRLKGATSRNADEWRWWDGDWFMAFRYVKKADTRRCPSCRGSGQVPIGECS